MRPILYAALLCALSVFLCLPGTLQAAESPAPAKDDAKPAKSDSKNPPLEALRVYTFDLIGGMSEKQLQYVYVIRTRHGIIRAVEIVRRDVGKAVGLCAKAHPDMKAPLNERYTRWKDNVNPILEDAQGLLERDIVKQGFVEPPRIRKLLDMTTKAGEYTDSQVVKEIVTTKEACDFLLKNMDLTQRDLPDLLRASLKNLPVPDPEDAPPGPAPKAKP